MIWMDVLADGLLAAVAGIGFGAISYPPKRAFVYIAVLAACGHAFRFVLMTYVGMDIATASFFASLSVGMGSLGFGKLTHCPMTVLYIPALLPMIPGMYAYRTIFALVMFIQKEDQLLMHKMFSNGIVTISVVFLLAVGATVPIFLFPKIAYSLTRQKKS
jgi:uncharacterized membrane protein YjjB (DUF3815 family)